MARWPLALALVALVGCASPLAQAVPPPASPPLPPQQPPLLAPPPPAASAAPTAPPAAAPPDAGAPAAAAEGDTAAMDDDADEDSDDTPGAALSLQKTPTSPLLQLGEGELQARFKQDPASLGSISAGRPSAGILINGVQMPKSEHWDLLDASHAWGTKETVDSLQKAIDKVYEQFPGAPPVQIGHISGKDGGHLSPHVSHQAGRDVDVGYFYRTFVPHGFPFANDSNLDLQKTWALVKAAIKETDIDMIFIDSAIQRSLCRYAVSAGEDEAFLDETFQVRGKNARAPIRHIKGHATHLHIRFHNPIAEELGLRVAGLVGGRLRQQEAIAKATKSNGGGGGSSASLPTTWVTHKARSGDTLVVLAKHYGTTVEEIQKANGLKSIALKIGVVYKIPTKVAPRPGAPVKGAPGRRAEARSPGSKRSVGAPH